MSYWMQQQQQQKTLFLTKKLLLHADLIGHIVERDDVSGARRASTAKPGPRNVDNDAPAAPIREHVAIEPSDSLDLARRLGLGFEMADERQRNQKSAYLLTK